MLNKEWCFEASGKKVQVKWAADLLSQSQIMQIFLVFVLIHPK